MIPSAKLPGYGGDTFAIEQVRDHDGRGKRELFRRVRYDVIDRLRNNRYGGKPAPLLTFEQAEAAKRLQVDNELATRVPTASIRELAMGTGDFGLSEAITDAVARVESAKHACGLQWIIIDLIVLKNFNITKAATAMRSKHPRAIKARLDAGLNLLAQHYGMLTR